MQCPVQLQQPSLVLLPNRSMGEVASKTIFQFVTCRHLPNNWRPPNYIRGPYLLRRFAGAFPGVFLSPKEVKILIVSYFLAAAAAECRVMWRAALAVEGEREDGLGVSRPPSPLPSPSLPLSLSPQTPFLLRLRFLLRRKEKRMLISSTWPPAKASPHYAAVKHECWVIIPKLQFSVG